MLQLTGILLALAGLMIPGSLLAPDDPGAARLQGILLFRLVSVVTGMALFGIGRVRFEASETRPVPWLPVGLVVGAALALRLIRLGGDLWYDEVVTLTEFVRLPTADLLTTYTLQNNHILYTLLAKLSIGIFGEGSAALRLPAALFGAGSVAAVFGFARRILPDPQAIAAAALIAFSYHHVWFSQNARGYTGLMCLGVLSTALFLQGLETRRSRVWLGYAATCAAAMYVHLTAVFLFAAHGLVWLALFAGGRRSPALARQYPGATTLWPLAGLSLGGLLTLQLYALILPQMLETFTISVTDNTALPKVSPWQSPIWTALEIVRRIPGGAVTVAVAAVGGAVAAHAWWRLLRRDPAAALLMALPIPLTLGALIAFRFHVWPRYFFPYMGFAAVLLVDAIAFWMGRLSGEPEGDRSLSRAATLALGLLAAGSLATVPLNYSLPKQAYSEAREFVESHRAPGEQVATVGLASLPYERFYAPDWTPVADADELARLEAEGTGTWLVYSFPTYMEVAHADVLEATRERYAERKVLPGTLGGGALYVYHRRGTPARP